MIAAKGIRLHDAYELANTHIFEDAFAAVIAGFADLRFATEWSAAARAIPGRNNSVQGYTPAECSVVVFDTALQASLYLSANQYSYSYEAVGRLLQSASWEEQKRIYDEYEATVAAKYRRGIKSVRTIDFRELSKIAKVVNGQEVDLEAFLEEHVAAKMNARAQDYSGEAKAP